MGRLVSYGKKLEQPIYKGIKNEESRNDEFLSVDGLMQIAVGEMGMPPQQFWNCTMRELLNGIIGFRRLSYNEFVNSWERTRYIAYYSLMPYIKDIKSMTSLLPLPWDKEPIEIDIEEKKKRYEELVKKWCHGENS